MSGLKFVIRRPRFPIICQIGAELVAGNTLQEFERRLKKVDLTATDTFSIVDARSEGWALHRDLSAISPLTIDKNWTKARLVEMFNASANAQRAGLQYPQRSLANRRLDAIIRDVAELLDQAERTVPRQADNATGA
jgi:hypothetical protein